MDKTKYLEVAKMNELTKKRGKKVIINNQSIALFLFNGKVFAIQNSCPHQQGDLADGYIREEKIFCPLHHWSFDLISGKYSFNEPYALKTYEVIIHNNSVFIKTE